MKRNEKKYDNYINPVYWALSSSEMGRRERKG